MKLFAIIFRIPNETCFKKLQTVALPSLAISYSAKLAGINYLIYICVYL